jgi:hypothetical protein
MTPRLFVLMAAFMLGSIVPAGAVPFVFPDRAAFIFAFPGSNIEGWDSFPDMFVFPNGSTTAGISYSSSAGNASVTNGFLASSGSNTLGRTPIEFFNVGDSVTFGFDTPLRAFGIDINTFATDNGSFTATTPVGTFPSRFDPFPGFTTGQFIGFSSDVPFNTVTIAGPVGFTYTLDTLRSSPVPEPASMLLLGGGLAALVARRYRHRPPSSRSS